VTPIRVFLLILAAWALSACAGPTVESLRDPVPETLVTRTAVPGYTRIRYWGDNGDGLSPSVIAEVKAQQKAAGFTSNKRD